MGELVRFIALFGVLLVLTLAAWFGGLRVGAWMEGQHAATPAAPHAPQADAGPQAPADDMRRITERLDQIMLALAGQARDIGDIGVSTAHLAGASDRLEAATKRLETSVDRLEKASQKPAATDGAL